MVNIYRYADHVHVSIDPFDASVCSLDIMVPLKTDVSLIQSG